MPLVYSKPPKEHALEKIKTEVRIKQEPSDDNGDTSSNSTRSSPVTEEDWSIEDEEMPNREIKKVFFKPKPIKQELLDDEYLPEEQPAQQAIIDVKDDNQEEIEFFQLAAEDSLEYQYLAAIKHGDVEELTKILQSTQKFNFHALDELGYTGWKLAVDSFLSIDIIEILLQYITDKQIIFNDLAGYNPLIDLVKVASEGKASSLGERYSRHAVNFAQKLIEQQPNLVGYQDKQGNTPLHYLATYNSLGDAKLKIAQMLMDNQVNYNLINKEGETPLFLAVQNNNKELFKILMRKTRDISYRLPAYINGLLGNNEREKFYHYIWMLPKEVYNKEIFKNFFPGLANNAAVEKKFMQPPKTTQATKRAAPDNGTVSPAAKRPRIQPNRFNEMPVQVARVSPHTISDSNEVLQLINKVNIDEKENKKIIDKILKGIQNNIRLLSDSNLVDGHGNNILQIVVKYGNFSQVKTLLSNGNIDLEHVDNFGQTALMYAVANGKTSVPELLKSLSQQENSKIRNHLQITDKQGNTMLHCIANEKSLRPHWSGSTHCDQPLMLLIRKVFNKEQLEEYGLIKNDDGKTAAELAKINLKHKTVIADLEELLPAEYRNNNVQQPLVGRQIKSEICDDQKNQVNELLYFIEQKLPQGTNLLNHFGVARHPFHLVVQYGTDGQILKLLNHCNINFNQVDHNGNSLLMTLMSYNKERFADILLSNIYRQAGMLAVKRHLLVQNRYNDTILHYLGVRYSSELSKVLSQYIKKFLCREELLDYLSVKNVNGVDLLSYPNLCTRSPELFTDLQKLIEQTNPQPLCFSYEALSDNTKYPEASSSSSSFMSILGVNHSP
jgi:ankyrin repeat protein